MLKFSSLNKNNQRKIEPNSNIGNPRANLDKSIKPTMSQPNENQDFKTIEKQRFSTFNPLLSDNIRFKKMYWNSTIENIGRIMLLAVTVFHLIFAYFLTSNLISNITAIKNLMNSKANFTVRDMIFIVMAFTIAFNLLIYIPMAISKNANSLFVWGIIYLILAISYFIIIQVFYTALIVVKGLLSSQVSVEIPFYMIVSLIITFIWIIGACLLIVKSDDIRNKLSVE